MKWWWNNRRAEIMGHRPIDADLKFYSAYARIAAGRPSFVERYIKLFMWSCVFFYVAWCIYDRNMGEYPTTVISARPVETAVPAGGKLFVHFELVRHKTCEYDMTWSVKDAAGTSKTYVEPHRNATGLIGPDSTTREFRLPDDIAIGPARLRLISSWACPANAYEAIYPQTYILPDIRFVVIPAKELSQ